MSRREPELLLGDIIESIQKIKNYTVGMSSREFFDDDKTLDAVIRNFEIIGEAANRMPEEIRDNNQNVNWHRVRGFRNRIVHDYMGIDYEIVWEIVVHDLDDLQIQIQKIIDNN
jgi:uncharacterized protein with HEPN domain